MDHINNKHSDLLDNLPENLQLLTPMENLNKDRDNHTSLIRCKLDYPIVLYEYKLSMYKRQLETAKLNKDRKACHDIIINRGQTEGRLRYYKAYGDLSHKNQLILTLNYLRKLGYFNKNHKFRRHLLKDIEDYPELIERIYHIYTSRLESDYLIPKYGEWI